MWLQLRKFLANASASYARQSIRFARIQRRQPIAVFNNYKEAAEAQVKKLTNKKAIVNEPTKTKASEKQVKTSTVDSRQVYETLQTEANRIYAKHDPYYQNETLTDDIAKDIIQNVDYVAHASKPKTYEFIELPDGDSRFGPLIQVAKSLRHRYEQQKILLEGKRLIKDAFESGVKFDNIYIKKMATDLKQFDIDLQAIKPSYPINLYKVSHKAIETWSSVETSQGILAIAKMPKKGECKFKRNIVLPITIVVDQVKDPGNMGAMIRIAAAIGCERMLLSKGCVDLWDPKVIRSGMGAHFRIPILANLYYEEIDYHLPTNTTLLYAESSGNNNSDDPIRSVDYTRFRETHEGLPHVTLVIGSESTGINPKIKEITKIPKQQQAVVHIPLANGVDSLNCTNALSVLGFELKRLFEAK